MSKINICKISKKGFIAHVNASDRWTEKGKAVLFRVRRLRKPPTSDGWICIHFVFLIFSLHFAIKGEIK